MATVVRTDPWSVIKTVNSLLFDDNFAEDIKCIQKAFESTANDVISVLDNNWQENEAQNKTILYQLLLTVFKDKNTNISNILQDFISVAPNPTSALRMFNDCNLREMVYLLTTQVFNALSSDLITPYIQNKMIQYFVDNGINGHKFIKMKQNTFINALASSLDDNVPTNVLQVIHQTLSSFEAQSIFECTICYRLHITECKDTHNTIRCVGCNSVISCAEYKTEPSLARAQEQDEVLGSNIVNLFDSRAGKALDHKVFPSLMVLLQRYSEGLIKIKHDNYCTRLADKNYDLIVKSLIAFISTIRCDNASCDHKSKLQCPCDTKFKEFVYALVLSINGLKSANNDSLLQKLALPTRTVATISTLFCEILPDKLKEERKSFVKNQNYIRQWVSFVLYDFKCFHCGHINRSILIDRMFQYAIRLTHCRLCHYKRGSKDEIAVDFTASQDNSKRIPRSDIITSYCGKLKQEMHPEFPQYKSGISMRYTVLRPKYGSLAEELRLNAIQSIRKEDWDKYLQRAMELHSKLEKDPANTALSNNSDEAYGISERQPIGVGHLLVVLIYTHHIFYARDFSRAYWYWQNENLFCDNFYWFGRYLYEAVHFFGIPFHHIRFKIKPLHHGLTARMVYDSVAPSIHFPAATNDKGTAATKAGTQGSVVSYAPKYIEGIENTKCVSTSQWSGYGNPEWLFMGLSKLQIASIRWKDEDYTPYNHAM
eukprot:488215_1